jgi:hypothetical protein
LKCVCPHVQALAACCTELQFFRFFVIPSINFHNFTWKCVLANNWCCGTDYLGSYFLVKEGEDGTNWQLGVLLPLLKIKQINLYSENVNGNNYTTDKTFLCRYIHMGKSAVFNKTSPLGWVLTNQLSLKKFQKWPRKNV